MFPLAAKAIYVFELTFCRIFNGGDYASVHQLFIPPRRPRDSVVDRSRLTDRLTATNGQRLTLISAPAGFGKTTLLSEWIPHSEHCVPWLSLDANDNDPPRFWAYVIAALQMLRPDLGASALALLESPQPRRSNRS